jgi:hypothetical protein
MTPVRTRASNFVYLGPTPDIGDAWVDRQPGHNVYLDWQPTDDERAAIAAGGLIRLGIHGMEPIPPVSLSVSDLDPLSAEAAALRDRARVKLRSVVVRGVVPAGHWSVSSDVWRRLNELGALDAGDGIPALEGRPLVELTTDELTDYLEYTALVDR